MRRWAAREHLSTWTSELVPVSSRTTSTLSRQSRLPRLPVPELGDTVDGYLKSLEPFYTIIASQGESNIDTFRNRQHSLAREFLGSGGIGEKLQQRLKGWRFCLEVHCKTHHDFHKQNSTAHPHTTGLTIQFG
jgi:hypothetical protein